MMATEGERLSPLDRGVLVSLTGVAVALILGAVVRDDTTYLGYLAGPGSFALLYFFLVRSP